MLYLLLHVRGVNAVDGYMPSVGLLPVGRGSIRQEVKTPEPNRDVLLLVNIPRTTEYCSAVDFILELILKSVKMTIIITKYDLRPTQLQHE